MLKVILKRISKLSPNIQYKLRQAGIEDKPAVFMKKTLITSLYMTLGIALFLFLTFSKTKKVGIILYLFPLVFIVTFFYLMKIPDALIKKKEKEISREIVYAGRFLVIEIESGVPLYNAFLNLAKNYKNIGKYFKQITDKVNVGISMEDAMNEAVELTPSNDFRRILWQIINTQKTGADVSRSLSSVIEQISREQNILLKEYGRRLNPIAMFYMIMAVIVPTLSVTFMLVITSMINLEISQTFLLFISFFLAFIQFMFLAIIKFLRPAVDF
ncbi:MAG: type II secretion system F family protein [Nanoarchaeota archaeon]